MNDLRHRIPVAEAEEMHGVSKFPKTCGRCASSFTPAAWRALELKGYAGYFFAGGKQYACEMRQCPCGNTLAIEVEVPKQHQRKEVAHGP